MASNLSAEGQALADAIGASVLKSLGKVRISVDTALFFASLSVKKILTTNAVVVPLAVPPYTTLVLTEAVPQGQTYLIALQQLAFDQDQALSIQTVIDNSPSLTYYDPSMFRMAYIEPINFIQTGNIPYAQRQLVTTITNLTAATQNISIITFGGYITNATWKLIIDNFFDIVQGVITSQAALEALAASKGGGG
jgi:hypothetical protein